MSENASRATGSGRKSRCVRRCSSTSMKPLSVRGDRRGSSRISSVDGLNDEGRDSSRRPPEVPMPALGGLVTSWW